jgi:hypothetical protein
LIEARLLLFRQLTVGLPTPLLVVLVVWLAIIFATFALFAPHDATVVTVFVVCALSIAGSFFLIVETNRPYSGFLRLSLAPLFDAYDQLTR